MSSPGITISSFFWSIVPAFINTLDDKRHGAIYISLDMRLNYWGKKTRRDYSVRIPLMHFVFMQGVRTFHMNTPEWTSPNHSNFPWYNFENVSNHDSCWRGAAQQCVFRTYMSSGHELLDKVKQTPNSTKNLGPCDLHQYISIHSMYKMNLDLERKQVGLFADRYCITAARDITSLT